jgi:hypothetical protein
LRRETARLILTKKLNMKKTSVKIILNDVHGEQYIKRENKFSETVQEDNWINLTFWKGL